MTQTLTIQYIPRIKEQSFSAIYRKSEKLGYHLNIGHINGYNFFYQRTNDTSVRLLQSKGNGIAIRLSPRFIMPVKNSKTEFYFEPLFLFKQYSFKDTAYSTELNYNDTAFFNLNNSYPRKFRGVEKISRTGIQIGFLMGWQFYFAEYFTASINSGITIRKQYYSTGYNNFGLSLHLNFGIGYVFNKVKEEKKE